MTTNNNFNSLTRSQGLVEPQFQIIGHATNVYIEEFIIMRTGPLRINMNICSRNDRLYTQYHVNITGSFGDNTDLSLHAGHDKDRTLLGTCHFNKFRASQIQVHPQDGPRLTMMLAKDYGYHWSMPWVDHSAEQGNTEMERHFYWRVQEKGTLASSGSGELLLELCSTDYAGAYAVYSRAVPGTRKGGILQLRNNLGQKWKTMVVLTLSALVEKARQTRARDGSFSVGMLAY